MLKCNSHFLDEGNQTSEMTYCENVFYGPYIDFIQKEHKKHIFVKFGRTYAENAESANLTRFQIVVKALAEISDKYPDKEIHLEIWKNILKIPENSDAFQISKIIEEFILKNVII